MELQVLNVVLCCVFTVALGRLVHLIYRWKNPPCNGRLPPGSMGLPLIGETLQFLKPSPSLDIPDFYKLRFKRYGSLFKTSFGGIPMVVSNDMEFTRFVFRQNDKLFQLWFPETATAIFGKNTMAIGMGQIHKHVRRLVGPLYAPKTFKEAFISEMERIIAESITLWATKPSINVKESLTDMVFDITVKMIIGFEPDSPMSKELRKSYDMFIKGLISFPLCVPGTKFYQSIQARKYVQKVIRDVLKQRLSAPQRQNRDFLGAVVEDLQSGESLVDDNFMVDMVSGFILAGILLSPTTIALGMQFLSKNPNVVEALTEEHEAILKKREEINSKITWEECKSMKFTNQVINEILRASSHTPGIFRKTLKDVQVNGYTIPEGWLVLINPMSLHLNPSTFKDPLTFNPWRWQEAQGSSLMKNFVPFGEGARSCLGADLTKLQMTMFLHELVTKYRWKEINGGQISRISDLVFLQDYRIQLFPRS